MIDRLKSGVGAIALATALAIVGPMATPADAALAPDLQSQLESAMSTGTADARVQAVVNLADANPASLVDIAAAAAVIDPDIADQVAGALAARLDSQQAKNEMVLAILLALGDAHEGIAMERAAAVVAAVPGSESVLETLIQTAAGGPFGDPDPQAPAEPVGRTFQNQTSDQIPFYDEVTQTPSAVTSPSSEDDLRERPTEPSYNEPS